MLYKLHLGIGKMIITLHASLLDLLILSPEVSTHIFDYIKSTLLMICVNTIMVTVLYRLRIICLNQC